MLQKSMLWMKPHNPVYSSVESVSGNTPSGSSVCLQTQFSTRHSADSVRETSNIVKKLWPSTARGRLHGRHLNREVSGDISQRVDDLLIFPCIFFRSSTTISKSDSPLSFSGDPGLGLELTATLSVAFAPWELRFSSCTYDSISYKTTSRISMLYDSCSQKSSWSEFFITSKTVGGSVLVEGMRSLMIGRRESWVKYFCYKILVSRDITYQE